MGRGGWGKRERGRGGERGCRGAREKGVGVIWKGRHRFGDNGKDGKDIWREMRHLVCFALSIF